jgi:hypothetical protein
MTQSSAATTAYLGGPGDGDSVLAMLDDLADLFEQWISRERERLTRSIERAAGEDIGNEGMS